MDILDNMYGEPSPFDNEPSAAPEELAPPDNIVGMAHRFIDLDNKMKENEKIIKEIEEENKKLNEEAQKLGRVLMELWLQNDIPSMKMRGKTLYIHKQQWAKPKDKNLERAVEILKEIGMEWLVEEKVNTHTVSSYVRECDKGDVELPKKFYEAFEVSDVFSIRSRKS